MGLVFAALALAGLISTYRAASEGDGGRAFALAILGGLSAVVAFGCFAGAVILTLVYRPLRVARGSGTPKRDSNR